MPSQWAPAAQIRNRTARRALRWRSSSRCNASSAGSAECSQACSGASGLVGDLDHVVVGVVGCGCVVVALVGEGGWSCADGQDDAAVGPDRVALAVDAAASGELLAVFLAVVVAAVDAGVDLVGGAVVDPFGDVVDFAEVFWEVAAGVVAASHEQLGRFTRGAGEEPLLAAHVDHDALRVDDDPSDVAGEQGAQ